MCIAKSEVADLVCFEIQNDNFYFELFQFPGLDSQFQVTCAVTISDIGLDSIGYRASNFL